LYLCLWNTKKHSKTLVGAPIEFETTQHTKNEEDMELQLERGQKLYFQKKLKQTITHPLPVFSVLLLYL